MTFFDLDHLSSTDLEALLDRLECVIEHLKIDADKVEDSLDALRDNIESQKRRLDEVLNCTQWRKEHG